MGSHLTAQSAVRTTVFLPDVRSAILETTSGHARAATGSHAMGSTDEAATTNHRGSRRAGRRFTGARRR